jgi:hypothetical protein
MASLIGNFHATAHYLPCMGLILRYRLNPSPRRLNHTDHGLPAGMNVNVLDRDLLLALAAVAIECRRAFAPRSFLQARLLARDALRCYRQQHV